MRLTDVKEFRNLAVTNLKGADMDRRTFFKAAGIAAVAPLAVKLAGKASPWQGRYRFPSVVASNGLTPWRVTEYVQEPCTWAAPSFIFGDEAPDSGPGHKFQSEATATANAGFEGVPLSVNAVEDSISG